MGLLNSCQDGKTCRIHGIVGDGQLNGKRIFLVPLNGPQTAEYVDSVVIADGKFEFATDSAKMFKILLDYHYRFNTQPLLVVAEPGDVHVVIDSISSAKGTPQNDSLQAWKEITEQYHRDRGPLNRTIQMLKQQKDTVEATRLQQQVQTIHLAYKKRTRQMAASMEGTTLGTFLKELYPLTYRRQMPDGTIVTMDADTNEPISE